jgi:serine/threonine protein kinase
MIDAPAHPSLDELSAFNRGLLGDEEWHAVERHISGCDDCGRKLDEMPGDVLAAMVRAFSGSMTGETQGRGTDWRSVAEIPPELVGHPRYRILRPLGVGGMGVVFQAVHRLMDRVVALKVVHRSLLDRPGSVERFRQEIRAAARLSHQNIVTAYDADQAGDVHFLVMEYVDGISLDRLFARQGPSDIARTSDWVRQTALGLQHAYERGMVHRDIKPGNLLLTSDGCIKILDFGLARFASERLPASGDTPTDRILGTPDYVAPEQARDPRRADIRADIYSLGCTLYHLLSGHPPFGGGTDLQKLIGHQERLPSPLTEVRQGVPPALDAILTRMLEKDPARRYQTPGEVARDLSTMAATPLTGLIATERALTPSLGKASLDASRPWRLYILAGAFVLAAVGALCVAFWPSAADQSRRDFGPEKVARSPNPLEASDLLSSDELALRKKEGRDRAIAWVRDHNRWGPGHAIVAKVEGDIDDAYDTAEVFELDLGSNLVRSGKTTLLTARAGELRVFELTPAQSKEMPLPASALGFHPTRHRSDRRRRSQSFTLSDLAIHGNDVIDGNQKISGTVAYRSSRPAPEELCLRLTYFPGDVRRSSFDNLDNHHMSDVGSLSFSFGSVGFTHPQQTGPLVVFLELCSFDADRVPIVESNTVTKLIFVKGKKSSEH